LPGSSSTIAPTQKRPISKHLTIFNSTISTQHQPFHPTTDTRNTTNNTYNTKQSTPAAQQQTPAVQ